jgi:hypothetical protein
MPRYSRLCVRKLAQVEIFIIFSTESTSRRDVIKQVNKIIRFPLGWFALTQTFTPNARLVYIVSQFAFMVG